MKYFWSYWVFSILPNGGRRPSLIYKFKILTITSYCGRVVDDSYQIWSTFGLPFWGYSNICKFQLGVGGHLGFRKISLLTLESCLGCRDGAWSKILWQSDEYFLSYSSLYENPRWRRRPSVFQNFRFLSIMPCCAYRDNVTYLIWWSSALPFKSY